MLNRYASTNQSTKNCRVIAALHAMSKKKLIGKLGKAKNGFLTYDIDNAKSSFFPVLCEILEVDFGAVAIEKPTSFVSEIVGYFEIGGTKLGYGWDNWSGAYILSFCEIGDSIVEKIAGQLNTKLKQVNYAKYVHM